ncbi:MAG: alpha/beta fold hydrolase [Micromonosporaceae bacterium]
MVDAPIAGTLAPGTHDVLIDGIALRYHIAGEGPICLVHPGGPGVGWDYLRLPRLEGELTLVYLEPVGTGASGRLADPRGYTLAQYARLVEGLIDHLVHNQATSWGMMR